VGAEIAGSSMRMRVPHPRPSLCASTRRVQLHGGARWRGRGRALGRRTESPLAETLEDPRQELRRDAFAGVGHLQRARRRRAPTLSSTRPPGA
jgi:hypothetical protein